LRFRNRHRDLPRHPQLTLRILDHRKQAIIK
jgi:hypothetical protein